MSGQSNQPILTAFHSILNYEAAKGERKTKHKKRKGYLLQNLCLKAPILPLFAKSKTSGSEVQGAQKHSFAGFFMLMGLLNRCPEQ